MPPVPGESLRRRLTGSESQPSYIEEFDVVSVLTYLALMN